MTKRKKVRRVTRRRFSEAFKLEALRQIGERRAAGESMEQIARDLDVEPSLLRQWARDRDLTVGVFDVDALGGAEAAAPRAPEPAGPEPAAVELRRLRRENARLTQERDFLKKAAAFFAKESR